MTEIGKLQRIPLRQVWQHEAYDFSLWLENNIEILNDLLGLELANPEREKSAGSFSVDLVAEDEQGNPVVIENQLEKSDHDHLGKLVTYLAAFPAKTAIWIVADPRPEHIQAIAWLNESLSTSFYLVKVEAIRIGNSLPAPLLTLIVAPSQESKDVGIAKKELAERDILRRRFWTGLLEAARAKTPLHAKISPTQYHWISTGASKAGLSYNYTIRQHDVTVELYIDRGKESGAENQEIFDRLYANKDEIESSFGDSLEWERLESKRACRIKKDLTIGGYRDEEANWQPIQNQMIEGMIKLEKALKTWISKLEI